VCHLNSTHNTQKQACGYVLYELVVCASSVCVYVGVCTCVSVRSPCLETSGWSGMENASLKIWRFKVWWPVMLRCLFYVIVGRDIVPVCPTAYCDLVQYRSPPIWLVVTSMCISCLAKKNKTKQANANYP